LLGNPGEIRGDGLRNPPPIAWPRLPRRSQALLRQLNHLTGGAAAVQPLQRIGELGPGSLLDHLVAQRADVRGFTGQDLPAPPPPTLDTSAPSRPRSPAPRACSGGMYVGVPSIEPACEASRSDSLRTVAMTVARSSVVALASASPERGRTLASPQSITWTSPK